MRAADSVEIIILVDNVVDLASTVRRPEAKRGWWITPQREGVAYMPWAEHGFAALIRLFHRGERHTLLFDAGASGTVLLHNAECMGLDWGEIDAIALSHGHDDHSGGIMAVLERLGGRRIPVFVHPDMFAWRGARNEKGQVRAAPASLFQEKLEAAGVDLVFNKDACPFFDSALYVLGEIPRRTDFEAGVPDQVRHEGDEWVSDPWVWDDRGVVMAVRGEGLVVVTGCAHAGLINTLLHARDIAGETRLRAVIGGFHLFGSQYEPHIGRVVSELRALQPDLLVPAHCTGKRGESALLEALPDAVVPGSALLRIRIPA